MDDIDVCSIVDGLLSALMHGEDAIRDFCAHDRYEVGCEDCRAYECVQRALADEDLLHWMAHRGTVAEAAVLIERHKPVIDRMLERACEHELDMDSGPFAEALGDALIESTVWLSRQRRQKRNGPLRDVNRSAQAASDDALQLELAQSALVSIHERVTALERWRQFDSTLGDSPPDFYSCSAVARVLDLPHDFVSWLCEDGAIPAQRRGDWWSISAESLRHIIEAGHFVILDDDGQGE